MVDIDSLKKLIDSYSSSTEMVCSLVDMEGRTLYSSQPERGLCRFCEFCEMKSNEELNCTNVHRYGIYQAERFDGKYTFFCPLGLVHWTSPIMIGERMEAAILGGPILLYDKDEYLQELMVKHRIPEKEYDLLRAELDYIPVLSHKRLAALSDLLRFLSENFSREETLRLELQQKELGQFKGNFDEYLPYLKSMGGETTDEQYPIEKEAELMHLISLGDKSGARSTLNEILGHVFFSGSSDFQVVKARVLELIVMLSRAALKGGASTEEIFGLNYKFLNEIHSFRRTEQLATWLAKIMSRFSDCVFDLRDVKHVDVIYKALEYIKKNYMNKISLAEVAHVSNISASYFSKIFKEEMGTNFNNYLNEIRVNMSKRLLVDESIPLVDVAFLSGFEDQSYYSKVFKKITGVSPGKYRGSMGRLLVENAG